MLTARCAWSGSSLNLTRLLGTTVDTAKENPAGSSSHGSAPASTRAARSSGSASGSAISPVNAVAVSGASGGRSWLANSGHASSFGPSSEAPNATVSLMKTNFTVTVPPVGGPHRSSEAPSSPRTVNSSLTLAPTVTEIPARKCSGAHWIRMSAFAVSHASTFPDR